MIEPPDMPHLLLARDVDRVIPAGPALRRAVRTERLVRVRRGIYVDSVDWRALDADARYLARVRAASLAAEAPPVLSHESAAVVWGLPIIGAWPAEVHTLVPRASGGRSDPGLRRHALGVPEADVTERHQLAVTTIARTVVDLAATARIHAAVAVADAALRVAPFDPHPMVTKQQLRDQWESMVPFRGRARALQVIEFATEHSGSPLESGSRVTMALAGFPEPELQRTFSLAGGIAMSDFYWGDVDGIGECDGVAKYTDARLRGGRTAEQVVVDEKAREDALRRQVRGFVRWGPAEALSPRLLTARLAVLGLSPGHSRRLRGN